jgi:hypothetical protein
MWEHCSKSIPSFRLEKSRNNRSNSNQKSSNNETRQQWTSTLMLSKDGARHRSFDRRSWMGDDWQVRVLNWDFWAAFADQGPLYHCTKYVQECDHWYRGPVQNWGTTSMNDRKQARMLRNGISNVMVQWCVSETLKFPFQNYSEPSSM